MQHNKFLMHIIYLFHYYDVTAQTTDTYAGVATLLQGFPKGYGFMVMNTSNWKCEANSSAVVEPICYKPEGRGFETGQGN
jgi:hypothetical protein